MAEIPGEHVDGGTIIGPEDNELTWEVTENDAGERTLTISGEGPMPDYSSTNTPPYQTYLSADGGRSPIALVIGDEVTRVGDSSFTNAYITSIDFGVGVGSIGASAFDHLHSLTSLYIPGNVKVIEDYAFQLTYVLRHVELAEGVQAIGNGAFESNVNSLEGTPEEGTLKIPASLTSIGTSALGRIFYAYEVDPGNPNYSSVDGVLYSKDGSKLIDYPSLRTADEFIVPATVKTIAEGAFKATYRTNSFVIPHTVESISGDAFRECSNLREVYIEDGVNVIAPSLMFYMCTNIQSVRLPEDTKLKLGATFHTNPSLASVTIPAGTISISQLTYGNAILAGLETLTYNAKDAEIDAGIKVFSDNQQPFQLVIGDDVDVLPAEFDKIARFQSEILFEPNNQITIEAGAFASAEEPLASLSGTVYVDDQGILYSYDAQAGTATLVNIPNNVTDAKIPATLTPESNVIVTVTGVAQGAAKHADLLKSVTFEEPENITSIALYAFANCPSLEEVNGEKTLDEVRKTFTNDNIIIGTNPFYNTGIDGASGVGGFSQNMHGQEKLTVSGASDVDPMTITLLSEGSTLTWEDATDGTGGGYRLLTGDTLTINANVNNTKANDAARYRVYLRLNGEDATLSKSPGDSIQVEDSSTGAVIASGTVFGTSDPYTIYVEFVPAVGSTVTLPITAIYPSPSSSGGGLTIWGMAGVKETADSENHIGELLEPGDETDVIQAYWDTDPDEFEPSKTNTNSANSVNVTGDGEGAAVLASDLTWDVSLAREHESSNYGKDFARSVDYVDVPSLPMGVSWAPEVLQDIKSGNTRCSGNSLYAGDTLIATLKVDGSTTISGRNVIWNDDENRVEIHWHYANGDRTKEAAPPDAEVTLKAEAFAVDLKEFKAQGEHVFSNAITTTVHYTHSADVKKGATATVALTEAEGNLALSKSSTDVAYFGEDIDYTLTVKNTGAGTYTKSSSHTVTDELSEYLYLKPGNIEKMFKERPADTSITITIKNATLGTCAPVKGVDGSSTAWRTPGNSVIADSTGGHTITITAADNGKYRVAVAGGDAYTATTVEEALRKAGYAPTKDSRYTYELALNGEDSNFVLGGGEAIEVTIYATVKTSFELLGTDRPAEYPEETTLKITNDAELIVGDESSVTASSDPQTVKREAVINKYVERGGEVLSEAPVFNDGDVLEYVLDFDHFGEGTYENLPMVDDLYGGQYLLVPVGGNDGLEKYNLDKKLDENTEYYILKEGNYENVKVGFDDQGNWLTAATVTVTPSNGDDEVELPGEAEGSTTTQTYTGVHTKISWYFSELSGNEYRIEVRYKALVSSEAAGGAGGFTVGNVVWMNDLPGRRITAGLWGGGSILNFNKQIVEGETTNDPAADITTEYSLVGPGDEVTYRLELRNDGVGTYNLTGADLADVLPQTFGSFAWETDDIELQTIITPGNSVTLHESFNQWGISSEYAGSAVGPSEGQQYITWPSDKVIATFGSNAKLFIYVTLTFPKNTEGDAAWDRYAEAAGGAQVQNTLWICGFASNVTHDLEQRGDALVQKGVYGTYLGGWQNNVVAVLPGTDAQPSTDRVVYNNADAHSRWVQYYAVVMNTGNSRLYLNDLYDRLPEGFTFDSLRATAGGTFNGRMIYTRGGTNDPATFDGEPFVDIDKITDKSAGAETEVRYKSARVTVESNEGNVVRLSFGEGQGDDAVKYDETRGQFYLDKGEAIVFGYICEVGFYSQTQDTVTNALGMPYEDYLGTGVAATGSTESDTTVGIQGDEFNENVNFNDGEREDMTADEVSNRWGLKEEGDGHSRWLVSEVTMRRTTATPGVSKRADSYTYADGATVPYEGSADPSAVINWETTLRNDGPSQIMDYEVTDTMEAPYTFVDDVTFAVATSDGTESTPVTLFSIGSHKTSDDQVTFTRGTNQFNVKMNSEDWTVVPDGSSSIFVKISVTEEGNEELSVWLLGSRTASRNYTWMIPESGGEATLSYHTENNTDYLASKPYMNDVYFEPDCEFDSTNLGSLVTDESGEAVGVTNTAPVNIAFGAATSSDKSVTEAGEASNTASALGSPNTITLGSAGSAFTYDLTVRNISQSAFDRMVLIDSLPDKGDASPFDPDTERGSQFKVSFDENSQVQVWMVGDDGKEITLKPDQYRVEFSGKTTFGDEDWNGASADDWSESSANARSLRVVIEEKNVVPAGATIHVSFNAVVDSEANTEPGAIAWNNFGYRYLVPGATESTLSAVSMPVGVKVPTVPRLVKSVVDEQGNEVTVDEESTFIFAIYKGEAIGGHFNSLDELNKALVDQGRDEARQVVVTVPAGDSTSAAVSLALENWTWEKGERYTITELGQSEDFSFRDFNNNPTDHFTFTYDPASQVTLTCHNVSMRWDFTITKIDGDTQNNEDPTVLAGAVFALYSPDQKDAQTVEEIISSEVDVSGEPLHPEYAELGINDVLTSEDVDTGASRTAYLADIVTLDETGSCTWENLARDRYYLLEVKAPDGYNLPDNPGQIVYRSSAEGGVLEVEVPNFRGAILPETGGSGTTPYIAAGTTLMAAAYVIHRMRRRRGEGRA